MRPDQEESVETEGIGFGQKGFRQQSREPVFPSTIRIQVRECAVARSRASRQTLTCSVLMERMQRGSS